MSTIEQADKPQRVTVQLRVEVDKDVIDHLKEIQWEEKVSRRQAVEDAVTTYHHKVMKRKAQVFKQQFMEEQEEEERRRRPRPGLVDDAPADLIRQGG